MMMTPPHPLLGLKRGLTRDEALEVTLYEGMWGYDEATRPAIERLVAEGLVGLGDVRGQPVVVNLQKDLSINPEGTGA
jgi:hypothetical protein